MPYKDTCNLADGVSKWLACVTGSSLRAAAHLNMAGLILAAVLVQRTDVKPMATALGAATLFLAAIQLYLLLRIEIDRQLFDVLASAHGPHDLAALDDALAVLALCTRTNASRSLTARSLGAFRFVRITVVVTALQLLAAGMGLLLQQP
ncbi:hypothetical protein [Massilia sp. S19_KUP03_FR1]|uniref:hypothetical protein n=1 Tax=Massilia sp. S19_KUP03_FR1 TaxID=3025503 RepID=UPI002FCDD6C0